MTTTVNMNVMESLWMTILTMIMTMAMEMTMMAMMKMMTLGVWGWADKQVAAAHFMPRHKIQFYFN